MKRLQQHRHALGSEAWLTLVVEDNFRAADVFNELWENIQQFEARFSRFLPDSELTYVNRQAGDRIEVSTEFLALVGAAKYMAEMTDGLYNPFILPGLQKAGYKGSWPNPAKHDQELDFANRRMVPVSELKVGDTWVKMPAHTALDFGGIGKGYLLDQLVVELGLKNVSNYWLSLGGDIVCAGHDLDGKPWRVGLQAADSTEEVGLVSNQNGERLAVATSGITKRRGPNWHHIIDPRTGLPAETDVLTATVCAKDGVTADIYAKCLVIVGSSGAEAFITDHTLTASLLQCQDSSGVIAIHKTGSIIAT